MTEKNEKYSEIIWVISDANLCANNLTQHFHILLLNVLEIDFK